MSERGHVLALCGGVGGAKLAFGLTELLAPDELSLIVNTGDDFEHMGLAISPDLDTVAYTLSGMADRERGWGIGGETWNFMAQQKLRGGESWFNLGDRDLATHVERTRLLRSGRSLSEATANLAKALGLRHAIIPMSDDPVRTIVETTDGSLPFQHYFVKEQCRPVARGIRFEGAETASPSPDFAAALHREDIAAVLICPSNPYLSIDPILAIPGVRDSIIALDVPVIAISPIIGGRALKGPAAKIMKELGTVASVASVASHYSGLIDGLVIDTADSDQAETLRKAGVVPLIENSIMITDDDRVHLAREALNFATDLARERVS
jgi:LPPG:FO 2-phospho-L-lactate transferase